MSGVGFLVKTFTPGGRRRRRRCEKQQHKLELPTGDKQRQLHQPDVVPHYWDAMPITPPAAFLPPGYKRGLSFRGRQELDSKLLYL